MKGKVQMKTAKEMFEEMDFEQTIYKNVISYEFEKFDGIYNWKLICFDLMFKTFYIDAKYEPTSIDVKTFKAIYKQCEELGWLNEE